MHAQLKTVKEVTISRHKHEYLPVSISRPWHFSIYTSLQVNPSSPADFSTIGHSNKGNNIKESIDVLEVEGSNSYCSNT